MIASLIAANHEKEALENANLKIENDAIKKKLGEVQKSKKRERDEMEREMYRQIKLKEE
jgi:regulator of replication initiation timing